MSIPYLYRIHTVIFLPFRTYNTDNQLIIDTTSVCFCEVATMSATDSCHAGAYPGFCLKTEDKKFLHYKKSPIPLEHIIIISIFAAIPLPCNISSYCGARGFCVYTRPCLAPQTPCRETCSTASDHTQRNHVRLNLPHKELCGSKN